MMRLGNADISGELQYKTCADQDLFYARDTGDVYNSVSQAARKPCIKKLRHRNCINKK